MVVNLCRKRNVLFHILGDGKCVLRNMSTIFTVMVYVRKYKNKINTVNNYSHKKCIMKKINKKLGFMRVSVNWEQTTTNWRDEHGALIKYGVFMFKSQNTSFLVQPRNTTLVGWK